MSNSKYYSIPYISNSTLTWFKVSPKYCWKRMNLEIADEEKSYTQLGKQLHLSLLEPEEFEKAYTYLDFKTPTSKQQLKFCEDFVELDNASLLGSDERLRIAYHDNYATEKMSEEAILKAANKVYETCSEYINYLKIRGDYREILSKSKQELITTVTNAIKSHKKANFLMFPLPEKALIDDIKAHNEFPIYWDYPINYDGDCVKCKSLVDRLVVDHSNKRITIVDLKTTSVLGDVTETIRDRNYYRQLAFYRLAVQHSNLFPIDYKIDAYLVTVNTQDPFECRVYKLSEEEYAKQVFDINKTMLEISWHWFKNLWDYSRTYYEGDGTENLTDEYSNESFEGNKHNGDDQICSPDVISER